MGLFGWLRAYWAKDAIPPPAADVLGAATLPVGHLPSVVIPQPKLSAADEKAKQARGYRNKNPGNIDFSERKGWLGQVGRETLPDGSKGRFASFETHEYGIRALTRLLIAYNEKHDLNTVSGIINRWAPPSDGNITSGYVAFVARLVGVRPDDPVDVTRYAIARPMVEAIIRKELGGFPYDTATIDAGLKLAGVMPSG